jgi:hypothetical protein
MNSPKCFPLPFFGCRKLPSFVPSDGWQYQVFPSFYVAYEFGEFPSNASQCVRMASESLEALQIQNIDHGRSNARAARW